MDILRLAVGPYDTNCYVLLCREAHSLLVDPGGDPGTLLSAIAGTQLVAILLTHGHPDHIGALEELHRATGAPIGVHPADSELLPVPPSLELHDGQTVRFGRCRVRVHSLPGHTPGSVGLELTRHCWLVGDTVFPDGPGRTDSAAQFAQLTQTLSERIFLLPLQTELLPGHGEPTTVGREREPFHRFLQRGWSKDTYGDVRWDTKPGPPGASAVDANN